MRSSLLLVDRRAQTEAIRTENGTTRCPEVNWSPAFFGATLRRDPYPLSLTTAPSSGASRVTPATLLGAKANPSRNAFHIDGGWANSGSDNIGGVCSIDIGNLAAAPELVLSPHSTAGDSRFAGPIRAIAPDPNVADALFVATGQDRDACRGDYPCDAPFPLLVQKTSSSGSSPAWVSTPLESDGLQKLYGMDIRYRYGAGGGTLWYAAAGTHECTLSW